MFVSTKSNLDLIFDRNNECDCISFLFICEKIIPNFWFLDRNQIFSSAQRELFQTEIGFCKPGRILMDRFFNEIMGYSGDLFVVTFAHTIMLI